MFEEFNHFFKDDIDDIYVEYTSSKQRNREKKFLKERHFVPDKDNPKTGMIDSTEIDPKTGKPIRIRFSFDNEILTGNASAFARGTDYIHLSELELRKHPDISGSIFAHEDGHLILNRDPEKSMKAVDMITKEIQNAGVGKLMNDHGNSADEYIADRNSLYKMGYDKTVRMLKHRRDYHLPKIYNTKKKSINSDPYKYVSSGIQLQENLKYFPKEALFLVGFGSSEQMYRHSIKRYEEMIKSEIAFKRKLQQEKEYNDGIGEFIDSCIKRYKDEIDRLKSEITKSKEERRRIHQKLINTMKVTNADENKLKKELISGVDELEKQNRVEMDFRIKMLSFWNKDKTVSESYGPNDDDTSGTSEFDESYNNDPNDCYCESDIFESGTFSKYAKGVDLFKARGPILNRSNQVYTNSDNIEKINDFPFDKVYFGSSNKLPTTMELDGPLFISPYPGIASIFSVRPQSLQKYGVPWGIRCNRAYDEWDRSLKDTVLQKPLTELHVRIQAENIKIKPTTELVSGYLYTIDVTPEIRDHIYQSDKMSKVFEFCIDKMDSVTFSNIKKINVRMTVTGEELPQEFKEGCVQEAKLPTSKRNKLPDSDFALVYTDSNGKKIRKYPVYDKAHVEAAAKMFPRGIPLKYQKQVAKRILREAHSYDIDTSEWKLNKYK